MGACARFEQGIVGDDMLRTVEVSKVWKHVLWTVHTHPLCDWSPHILKWILGDDTPTIPNHHFAIKLIGLYEIIEHLATIDCTTNNNMVTAPTMISSFPIIGKGASKF
jgi:hypothetical protein